MCLITIAITKKPSLDDMKEAAKCNGDGIGIAWRENKKVRFVKGIDKAEKAFKFMECLPMPFVIHYRWASSGGKSAKLCHPFPITKNVELMMKGTTDSVLFHNGNINDWRKTLAQAAIAYRESIPDGAWSDTRSVAWIVARLGETFLETQEGKWVFFSGEKLCFYGDGWEETENGAQYNSNNSYKRFGSVGGHYPNYSGCSPLPPPTPATTTDIVKNEADKEFEKKKKVWEEGRERIRQKMEDKADKEALDIMGHDYPQWMH